MTGLSLDGARRWLVLALAAFALLSFVGSEAFAQCKASESAPVNKKGVRPGTNINYNFDANVPQWARDGMIDAMNRWMIANTFTRHNVTFSPGQNGIQISYNPLAPGVGMQTGITQYSPDGFVLAAHIQISTNTQLIDNRSGANYLGAHEVGHVLGLGDRQSTDGKSVMNQAVGKNDSGNGTRHKGPSICDATKVSQAHLFGQAAGVPGPVCPGGGCYGYSPFPQPCSQYDDGSAWCYPGPPGFTPEDFPDLPYVPPMTIYPGVVIVSPPNGSMVSGAVTLLVASGDSDGRVMSVEYFVNGQSNYLTAEHPFSWNLSLAGVPPGQYSVQAKAADNQGFVAWSSPIALTVQAGGGGGGGGSSVLASGQEMFPEEDRWSPNGQFRLLYQNDGNLVLYGPTGVIWETGTFGAPNRLAMQGDGNLVIYDASWTPVWASDTPYSPGAWMTVSDNGFIVVYSSSGNALWCSCW